MGSLHNWVYAIFVFNELDMFREGGVMHIFNMYKASFMVIEPFWKYIYIYIYIILMKIDQLHPVYTYIYIYIYIYI